MKTLPVSIYSGTLILLCFCSGRPLTLSSACIYMCDRYRKMVSELCVHADNAPRKLITIARCRRCAAVAIRCFVFVWTSRSAAPRAKQHKRSILQHKRRITNLILRLLFLFGSFSIRACPASHARQLCNPDQRHLIKGSCFIYSGALREVAIATQISAI